MSTRPNPMPRLYRWRSNVFLMPMIAFVTVVCGTVALLVSVVEKSGKVQHRIARFWARCAIWASWSKLTVIGEENLRKYPVAVYASNHTSYMDTPVIFATLPFQFRILDTANPHATLSSLGVSVKALRAGMPLFVFPEGGRTLQGELKPFLSGAAYLAIRAQRPLVPIALSGVYDLLPMHTRHLLPGKLTLRVGVPIETTGMTVRQIEELTEKLRGTIEELLEPESSATVGATEEPAMRT